MIVLGVMLCLVGFALMLSALAWAPIVAGFLVFYSGFTLIGVSR